MTSYLRRGLRRPVARDGLLGVDQHLRPELLDDGHLEVPGDALCVWTKISQ